MFRSRLVVSFVFRGAGDVSNDLSVVKTTLQLLLERLGVPDGVIMPIGSI